ncbi:hypothetical protein GH733_005869 [Mirounga leonina]|nr:hypothetical protein GH733_005869 [Mirounga leonina]
MVFAYCHMSAGKTDTKTDTWVEPELKRPELKKNPDRQLNQGPLCLHHKEHQGDLACHNSREPDPDGG